MNLDKSAKIVKLYTLRIGLSLIARYHTSIQIADALIYSQFYHYYEIMNKYQREIDELNKIVAETDEYFAEKSRLENSTEDLSKLSINKRIEKLSNEMAEYNSVCRNMTTALLRQVSFLTSSKAYANQKVIMTMEANERLKFAAKQIYHILVEEYSQLLAPSEWKNLDNELKKDKGATPLLLDVLVEEELKYLSAKISSIPYLLYKFEEISSEYKEVSSERIMEFVDEIINNEKGYIRIIPDD